MGDVFDSCNCLVSHVGGCRPLCPTCLRQWYDATGGGLGFCEDNFHRPKSLPPSITGRWETKDSGARSEYASGMVRDTQEGKARFDLCHPEGVPYNEQMLTRFAMLMERGMQKYGERNWEKADSTEEYNRFRGSAMRHCEQWFNGELDEDHAAATFFNIMAAETLKWKLRQKGQDGSTKDSSGDEGRASEEGGSREEGSAGQGGTSPRYTEGEA